MSEPQKERLISPLKLTVAGLASMTAAVVGSFFGDSGTLIGTGLGSVVSGTAAAMYEHAAKKAREKAKSLRKTNKPDPEQVFLEDWFKPKPRLRDRIPKRLVAMSLAGVAVAGATGYGFVAVTEASTGQTLHGITTQSHDYGSSFSGSSDKAPPAPKHHRHHHHHHKPHATPSPSPTITAIPSPTLQAVPSPTITLTPVPSVTATPTLVPTPSSPNTTETP